MGAIGSGSSSSASSAAAIIALQNSITQVLSNFSTLVGQIGAIDSRTTSTENNVSGLTSQQQQNVANITAANAALATVQSNLDTTNQTVGQHATDIAGLRTDMTNAQATLTTHSAQISVLQGGGNVESTAGFTITSGTGTIYDAGATNAWTIVGGVPKKNGTTYGAVTGIDLGLYFKPAATGTLYFHKSDGTWYKDVGSNTLTLQVTGDPRAPTTFTESTNGATITDVSGGQLVASNLDLYTISGGQILRNVASAYTGAVAIGTTSSANLLLYYKPASTGKFYYRNTSNAWFSLVGTTWSAESAGDPRAPAVITESASGTTFEVDGPGVYVAGTLDYWHLVSNFPSVILAGPGTGSMVYKLASENYSTDHWPNTTTPPTDTGNNGAVQGLYYQGQVYQKTGSGSFYRQTLTTPFGAAGPLTDPRIATSGFPAIYTAMQGMNQNIQESHAVSNQEFDNAHAAGVKGWRIFMDNHAINSWPTVFANTQCAQKTLYAVSKGKPVLIQVFNPLGTGAVSYSTAPQPTYKAICDWINANNLTPAQVTLGLMNEPSIAGGNDAVFTLHQANMNYIRSPSGGNLPNHYITCSVNEQKSAGVFWSSHISLACVTAAQLALLPDTRVMFDAHTYLPRAFVIQVNAAQTAQAHTWTDPGAGNPNGPWLNPLDWEGTTHVSEALGTIGANCNTPADLNRNYTYLRQWGHFYAVGGVDRMPLVGEHGCHVNLGNFGLFDLQQSQYAKANTVPHFIWNDDGAYLVWTGATPNRTIKPELAAAYQS